MHKLSIRIRMRRGSLNLCCEMTLHAPLPQLPTPPAHAPHNHLPSALFARTIFTICGTERKQEPSNTAQPSATASTWLAVAVVPTAVTAVAAAVVAVAGGAAASQAAAKHATAASAAALLPNRCCMHPSCCRRAAPSCCWAAELSRC